jgi:hypothetical protein
LGCYNQSTRSESVLIQTRLLRQFLINYPNPTRHVATSLETMVDIMRSGFMVELERIRLGEEAKASKTLDDDMGKTGGWAPRTTPEVSLPSPSALLLRHARPCSRPPTPFHVRAHAAALLLCHARPVRARGCPSSTFARTRLPCSSVMRALLTRAPNPSTFARGCVYPIPQALSSSNYKLWCRGSRA